MNLKFFGFLLRATRYARPEGKSVLKTEFSLQRQF